MVPMLAAVKQDELSTPIASVLAMTFACSLGSAVFWHGIPFIAKQSYGFTQVRTLAMAAAMGGTYTLGAFTAGRVTRLFERRLSPRGVLGACVGVLAMVSLGPAFVDGQWALWVAGIM